LLVAGKFTHVPERSSLRDLYHGEVFRMFEPDGMPVKCTSTGREVFMAACDGYTDTIDGITTSVVRIYDGLVIEGKIFGRVFDDENDERVYTLKELKAISKVLPNREEFNTLLGTNPELTSLKFVDFKFGVDNLLEQVRPCEKISGMAMTFRRQTKVDTPADSFPEILLEIRAVEIEDKKVA